MAKLTLLEFFSLRESDPDPLDPQGTRPKHAMPSGMHKVKQQGVAPRSTMKQLPPQRKVDPATEFLRSKGALSGIHGPGSGLTKPGPKPNASQSAGLPDEMKPKYKGTYPGQTVNTGGRYVNKRVSWLTDPEDQSSRRNGWVQGKQDDMVTWDGNDWVPSAQWSGKKG